MSKGRGLLNYTTTIASDKTVLEIQGLLARTGAESIMTEYANGEPIGLSFRIETPFGVRPYTLPVDPGPVEKVLYAQWRAGKVPRRYADREQAQRVAWRITKDWIEAQLALIETQMVTLDQVMLPYLRILDERGESRTLYHVMAQNRLELPRGTEPVDAEIEEAE